MEAALEQISCDKRAAPPAPISSEPIPAVPGLTLIHNVLTPTECEALSKVVLQLHTRLDTATSAPRRGSQHHIAQHVASSSLKWLAERLEQHMPASASAESSAVLAPLDSAISGFLRTYCYEAGDFSAPHWDKSFRQVDAGGKVTLFSAYSVLLYLNSGFEGGATTFFSSDGVVASARGLTPLNAQEDLKVVARVEPRRGSVLLFPHGKGELLHPDPLHEGSVVRSGKKLLIRTDLIYRTGTLTQTQSQRRSSPVVRPPARQTANGLVIASIEGLVGKALAQVCPEALQLIRVSVKKSPNQDYELETSCVEEAFWALFRRQRRREANGRKAAGHPVVRVVSDYGLEQTLARDALARKVVEALPRNRCLAFVTPSRGGTAKLYIISAAFAELRFKAGLLCCARCGKFVDKGNGLEWHLRNVHNVEDHRAVYGEKEAAQHALSIPVGGTTRRRLNGDDLLKTMRDPSALQSFVKSGRIKQLPVGLEQCRNGDLVELKRLVSSGEYDARRHVDTNGAHGLLWAAGFGHVDVCMYLVKDCKADVHHCVQRSKQAGYDGRTAVHWAARNGHVHLLRWFLEDVDGVAVDIPTSDGTTPFHLAGQMEACKYLLAQGADPHACNSYGCSSAHWCCQSAFSKRSLVLCKWLKANEVDFATLNANGQGCLHKAAQRGNTSCCRWLLQNVDLDAAHFRPNLAERSTPSELARYAGFAELTAMLKEREDEYVQAEDQSGSFTNALCHRPVEDERVL